MRFWECFETFFYRSHTNVHLNKTLQKSKKTRIFGKATCKLLQSQVDDIETYIQTAMKKHIADFTVVDKKNHGQHYFILRLQSSEPLPEILPGQFVEVEVPDNKEVFLRRPISIHDVDYNDRTICLLVQIVGKGTATLSRLDTGRTLNLVFPLGNGFSLLGDKPLLVGGGAGLAPLLYTARKYSEKGIRPTVLLGGRTAELIPVKDEFKAYGEVFFATEDGSLGEKGLVTQHPAFGLSYDHIITCGPTPMMKAVARHALQNGINCEVSLENTMACGVGACLCCVTKTDHGHRCVCKDGPVFNVKDMKEWAES